MELALRDILTEGNPMLRRVSRPVTAFDSRLRELVKDMKQTLRHAEGAGLAAPQVGILRRVVVIDIGEGAFELVNPVMVEKSGEQECVEGCLSVPGKRGKTRRPARVTVEAFDHRGNPVRIEGEGLLALALCHELDHLDGRLYIDIVEGPLWEVDE
ncbi:MAG: peptide deformylase [Christensenellales bacterium]|jgi:peptide deformylase